MNALNYDAMVMGNHEPDFSASHLRTLMREARFPVLAANVVLRRGGQLYTRPYILKTINGVRVGILGIAYPNTPLTTARKVTSKRCIFGRQPKPHAIMCRVCGAKAQKLSLP